MKKYLILLLFAFLPSLLMAQAAGGAIKRPVKKQTTSTTKKKKETKRQTNSSTTQRVQQVKKDTESNNSTTQRVQQVKKDTESNNSVQQQQARETQSGGLCPDSNHPHMIDLGLPSGTLWSCCNVGSSKPEGYGNYYAWGETKTKSVYNWDTYQYGRSSNDVDNIGSDIAGTRYDAATANWGTPWKMPTKAQCEELKENTTSKWTTHNGVKGRMFTSKKNGRSLFLPAAGLRWYDELNLAGSFGFYWSSSLSGSNQYYAWSLYFESGNVDTRSDRRDNGLSVRPVR